MTKQKNINPHYSQMPISKSSLFPFAPRHKGHCDIAKKKAEQVYKNKTCHKMWNCVHFSFYQKNAIKFKLNE